jgi:hypothetical protein
MHVCIHVYIYVCVFMDVYICKFVCVQAFNFTCTQKVCKDTEKLNYKLYAYRSLRAGTTDCQDLLYLRAGLRAGQ